jgi:hypothetical protein
MKTPEFLSPFIDGDSPKRLIQGCVVGVVATLVIGFGWGGWNIDSTVKEKVSTASETATVTALAPICAERFTHAAETDSAMVDELKAVRSWERDRHLMKGGWATFAGGAEPDYKVATACADLIVAELKIQ